MGSGRGKIPGGQSGELIVTLAYNPTYIENLKEIKGHNKIGSKGI